jgi:hypothetical protein
MIMKATITISVRLQAPLQILKYCSEAKNEAISRIVPKSTIMLMVWISGQRGRVGITEGGENVLFIKNLYFNQLVSQFQ